jgi:four helix bundle protein
VQPTFQFQFLHLLARQPNEESLGGISRKEFIMKLTISYKEARETLYWIRLMTETGYLEASDSKGLLNDCLELVKILSAIIKTSKDH